MKTRTAYIRWSGLGSQESRKGRPEEYRGVAWGRAASCAGGKACTDPDVGKSFVLLNKGKKATVARAESAWRGSRNGGGQGGILEALRRPIRRGSKVGLGCGGREALMKTLCQLKPLSKRRAVYWEPGHEKRRRAPGKKRSFIVNIQSLRCRENLQTGQSLVGFGNI